MRGLRLRWTRSSRRTSSSQKTGRPPQQAGNGRSGLVQHLRQAPLGAGPLLDIVLHAETPLRTDDPENPYPRVRMIRLVAGEQELGSPAKDGLVTRAISELA